MRKIHHISILLILIIMLFTGSCSLFSPKVDPEIEASVPQISITSVTNGQFVPFDFNIEGSATDKAGIKNIRIYATPTNGNFSKYTNEVSAFPTGSSFSRVLSLPRVNMGAYKVWAYAENLFLSNAISEALILNPKKSLNTNSSKILIKINGGAKDKGGRISFGSLITNTLKTNQVEISNTGSANLIVYSISISGDEPDVFSAPDFSSLEIESGQSARFSLIYQPSSAGRHSALMMVNNNSETAPVYNFTLEGKATETAQAEISLFHFYNSSDAEDIENSTTNTDSATTNTDTTSTNTTNATSTAPADTVQNSDVPKAEINSGDTIDFGNKLTNSVTSTNVISFLNTGSANMEVWLSIEGSDNSQFSIDWTNAVISPNGSKNLRLSYLPQTTGAHNAQLIISNNDPNSSRIQVLLKGEGTVQAVPGLSVRLDNQEIPDGTTNQIGSLVIESGSLEKTVTVRNSGSASLVITNQISGNYYTTTASNIYTITPDSEISYKVKFSPLTVGSELGQLSISHNVQSLGVFDIYYTGSGTQTPAPEAEITIQGNVFHSGFTNDFGSIVQSSGTITNQITVKNIGTTNLIISGIASAGSGSSYFSHNAAENSYSILPDGSRNFEIYYTPTSTGSHRAYFAVTNNVLNDPMLIYVKGQATAEPAPELSVMYESSEKDSGFSIIYGTISLNQSVSKTVTINNNGTKSMNISNISISGNSQFTHNASSFYSIQSGESVQFSVTFTPSAEGSAEASLTFNSDDSDEGSFSINLNGKGGSGIYVYVYKDSHPSWTAPNLYYWRIKTPTYTNIIGGTNTNIISTNEAYNANSVTKLSNHNEFWVFKISDIDPDDMVIGVKLRDGTDWSSPESIREGNGNNGGYDRIVRLPDTSVAEIFVVSPATNYEAFPYFFTDETNLIQDIPNADITNWFGANYQSSTRTTFNLYAPNIRRAWLVGDFTSTPWSTNDEIEMNFSKDRLWWWTAVTGQDLAGKKYKFIVEKYDGNRYQIIDPAAKKNVDVGTGPSYSAFSGVTVNSDNASVVVDQSEYTWQSTGWQRPDPSQYNIYEIHPGGWDATIGSAGENSWPEKVTGGDGKDYYMTTFDRMISNGRLDYVTNLGFTAIEPNPINEFEGDHSWGYNYSLYYAPESSYVNSYTSVNGLKRFVDAMHQRGLAIVMDTVYNHIGPSSDPFHALDTPSDNNDPQTYFFGGKTPWAQAPNFSNPMMRKFMIDSAIYFMKYYRIDAFRLDATAYIDNYPGGWDFMKEYTDAVRAAATADGHGANLLITTEYLPVAAEVNKKTADGGLGFDSLWNVDMAHQCTKIKENSPTSFSIAAMTELIKGNGVDKNSGTVTYLDNGLANQHPTGLYGVNYFESHDEVGNGHARIAYNIKGRVADNSEYDAQNNTLVWMAAAVFGRGIPMVLFGQENLLGFYEGNPGWMHYADVEQNIFHWSNYTNARATNTMLALRDMNWIRKTNSQVYGNSISVTHANEAGKVLSYVRGDGSEGSIYVIHNFSKAKYGFDGEAVYADFPFPGNGIWKLLYASPSAKYGDSSFSLSGWMSNVNYTGSTWGIQLPEYGVLVYKNTGAETAPSVSNLSWSDTNTNQFTIKWMPASDDLTASNDLQYKLVYSTAKGDIDTPSEVDNLSGSGVVSNWSSAWSATTENSQTLTGIEAGTEYWFVVAVKDGNGNISLYGPTNVTTATPPSSADARLGDLTIGQGTMSPSFVNTSIDYSVYVTNIDTLTVTAKTNDPASTLKFVTNNITNSYTSETDLSFTLTNATGGEKTVNTENTIRFIVTAQDGSTVKTYTVKVYKSETMTIRLKMPSWSGTIGGPNLDYNSNGDDLGVWMPLTNTNIQAAWGDWTEKEISVNHHTNTVNFRFHFWQNSAENIIYLNSSKAWFSTNSPSGYLNISGTVTWIDDGPPKNFWLDSLIVNTNAAGY